ncbi:MAG: AAA family ATPase [Desulfovibrio sp.]|jgi:ATP-dependent 26S proteasome regulatory subunit|nr:AAA family ATPase [Desulfovibrio sp.]
MGVAIDVYLKAGYPALYIQTLEQERAMTEVIQNLRDARLSGIFKVMCWKSTTGLADLAGESGVVASSIEETLKYICGENGECRSNIVYILFNVKEFLKSPIMIQQFRDAAYMVRTVGSHMILIGGGWNVPEELEDVITFVDLELPNREEIKTVFQSVIDRYREFFTTQPDAALLQQAAENALGLTELKAENAISLSIVSSEKIDIPLIRKEKQLAVKKSGVLEYLMHNETIDTLGGFDVLKEHVSKRRKYFSNQSVAIKFGLRPPKGIMLVGLAGVGKTLAAKAVSAELDLPLYKFDVGTVFKGVVGGSEEAIRGALKLAETVAPCVLLIDEMEKLMDGLESSGKSDSGTTSRVIGTFISWMQETNSPIYKVATCNTIRNLDAALFRRGRWDAVFAVDLPTFEERKAIFAIHLNKRKRNVDKFDFDELASCTEGFVGAEIESVVEEAMYQAFDADRDIISEDLIKVAHGIIPISMTDKENIERFREWMKYRAVPVSRVPKANIDVAKKQRNLRMRSGVTA